MYNKTVYAFEPWDGWLDSSSNWDISDSVHWLLTLWPRLIILFSGRETFLDPNLSVFLSAKKCTQERK